MPENAQNSKVLLFSLLTFEPLPQPAKASATAMTTDAAIRNFTGTLRCARGEAGQRRSRIPPRCEKFGQAIVPWAESGDAVSWTTSAPVEVVLVGVMAVHGVTRARQVGHPPYRRRATYDVPCRNFRRYFPIVTFRSA